MSTSNTADPWAEEPDNDARRIAKERRHHAKDAHWISVEQALKIEGTTDPTRLRMEIKRGLPCRFRHRGRWWQFKPVEEIAPLLTGRNPLDLQDDRWELVVHEKYLRERLGKLAAPAPPGDMPPIVTDTATNLVEPSAEQPSKRAVETPAPAAPEEIPVENKSNAGAPPQHDWDEASQYAEQLWREWGDPRDPLSDRDGYRSDIDLARHVADHLRTRDPGRKPPDPKYVADKLRPEIKKLRERQLPETLVPQ